MTKHALARKPVYTPNPDGIVRIHGRNAKNKPVYAFLKISRNRLDTLMQAVETNEDLDITECGELLAMGEGEPGEDVQALMQEYYQQDRKVS
jgi:V8-like Glu-specific endopeptidase